MNSKLIRRSGALLSAAAVAGLSMVTAHATDVVPFTCSSGAAINGDGSSFQAPGVQAAASSYGTQCGNSVTYTSTGSGKGIADFTARAVQFAGTDVPYSDQQWAAMQAGGGTNASPVQTIPIALGAVAVAVNEPCAAGAHVSGTRVAQIYAQKSDSLFWDQVVAGCGHDAIVPLHRSGNSGTTTAFKTYLTKKDAADYAAGCAGSTCYKDSTPNWPAPGTVCAGANTNQNLVTCLGATAGGVAYLDESDASSSGASTLSVDNAQGSTVDQLDLAGQHSAAQTVGGASGWAGFAQPAAGQCTTAAEAQATPTATSADWSQVDITDGPNGYGICTYTYQLAFDAPVTAGAASSSQATTVRNFIQFEVSDAGQAIFVAHNYDSLPVQVQAAAQAGAQALTNN